jgi:hypothetical protein
MRFGSVEIGVIWVFPNAGCSSGFLRLIFKVTTPRHKRTTGLEPATSSLGSSRSTS